MEAEIGIIGGSGLYSLLDEEYVRKSQFFNTAHGQHSGPATLGEIDGKNVIFIPRHGSKHQFPPHNIPYKANIHLFEKFGVKRIIAPCAAGSLQPSIKPGEFVICDQFVDRTHGRDDTFFHGPDVAHISSADPYCPEMRKVAVESCKRLKIPHHEQGTCVVINGPRFSTKAESQWFHNNGWEVINMTQYPECVLAREKGMCYLNISLITDYDAGLEGHPEVEPVSAEDVAEIFSRNIDSVKKLIFDIVGNMPERSCECSKALEEARL